MGRKLGLPGDGVLLGLMGSYIAAAIAISLIIRFPIPGPVTILSGMVGYLVVIATAMAPLYLFHRVRSGKEERPTAFAKRMFLTWRVAERFRGTGLLFVVFVTFTMMAAAMKSAIPALHPFTEDPAVAGLEARILGGDAWSVLQPVLGYPIVTFVLNLAYHTWAVVLLVVTTLALFWIERPALRLQYLIAYILIWIVLGTILATALSSVGPCFYEMFYHDNRFAPLTNYLHFANREYPLMVLNVQQELVSAAREGKYSLGRGMSAMPSMHVATTTLFALLAWRVSKGWGIAATAFLVLIFLGSIHLGYHYALDGVVSLIVTPLLWALAGAWARAIVAPRAVLVTA